MMKTHRKSEIYQRLPARHVAAFEELVRNPSAKIDTVHEWLAGRGCKSSRSAVARCMKVFRDQERLRGFCPDSIGATERELRSNLRRWAGQLSGPALAAVTLFAGVMAHANREKE